MSTAPETSQKYRPNVGITLFNGKGDVFVGERIDTPGAWQMPQGGVDEGEDIESAGLRELKEEVGTDKAEIIKIAPQTICYDLPSNLTQELWNGVYRGQEQTWIAAKFTGDDTDIDIHAHPLPEFSSWQWVPLSQTLDLIVPFKRDAYKKVITFFEDIDLS